MPKVAELIHAAIEFKVFRWYTVEAEVRHILESYEAQILLGVTNDPYQHNLVFGAAK